MTYDPKARRGPRPTAAPNGPAAVDALIGPVEELPAEAPDVEVGETPAVAESPRVVDPTPPAEPPPLDLAPPIVSPPPPAVAAPSPASSGGATRAFVGATSTVGLVAVLVWLRRRRRD